MMLCLLIIKRTVSDKFLKGSVYEIALNPQYDGYHRKVASMVYKIFDKKIGLSGTSKVGANANEVLAQQFLKPVIKKIQKTESVFEV